MKNSFSEFDSGVELGDKWKWDTALFVFDTNVLLNLYRYGESTRKEWLNVLDMLSDQIWIPHHVALEFHRGRLGVIAAQNSMFKEVENILRKAETVFKGDINKLDLRKDRHSLIDPDKVKKGMGDFVNKSFEYLKSIEENILKVNEPDPIRSRLEELFDGRVGEEPADQKQLDEVYETASRRFRSKIPPGYMDAGKDQNGPAEYLHRGLFYQRKYGDYLVWHQLLQHTRTEGVKKVAFVTDDSKEDWWSLIKVESQVPLGPRPELLDEAKRVGGIESFKMLQSGDFMAFAQDSVQAGVSNATLEEIRDVSSQRQEQDAKHRGFMDKVTREEQAVLRWLERRFPRVTINTYGFPHFTVENGGHLLGVEVKLFRTGPSFRNRSRAFRNRLRDWFRQIEVEIYRSELDSITLVVLLPSMAEAREVISDVEEYQLKSLPDTVSVMVAGLIDDDSTVPTLNPVFECFRTKGIQLWV